MAAVPRQAIGRATTFLNVTSAALAYTNAIASGSGVASAGRWNSNAMTSITCSDGHRNWTQSAATTQSTTLQLIIAHFLNYTDADTPTVTWSWTTSASFQMILIEESVPSTSALDQAAGSSSATGTNPTSGAVTTTTADEFLLGAFCTTSDTTFSETTDASWLLVNATNFPSCTLTNYPYSRLGWAVKTVSATGSQNASIDISAATAPWCARIATFTDTASGGGSTPLPPGLGPVVGMIQPMQVM